MFIDRYHAGKKLAAALQQYADTDTVVLAISRGGVLIGYEIARSLHVPLDMEITGKVMHPLNREIAICALTEDGTKVCDDRGLYGLDVTCLDYELELVKQEAMRKRKIFDSDRPACITGKTVIIVDDGTATSLTFKAVLMMIQVKKPKKVVVALPVCAPEILTELRRDTDEVVVLNDKVKYRAQFSSYYQSFPEVSDSEVTTCLKSAHRAYTNC